MGAARSLSTFILEVKSSVGVKSPASSSSHSDTFDTWEGEGVVLMKMILKIGIQFIES